MALIPPAYLDAVVAVGDKPGDGQTKWIATGFLYGKDSATGVAGQYHPFLVTNRHVVRGRRVVRLRFNPSGQAPAREYDAQLVDAAGQPLWCAPSDKEADVVVVAIDYERIRKEALSAQLFLETPHAATKSTMQAMGISEGSFVYVLGFPFGDVGGPRSYVVVRSGSIARVSDTLAGLRGDFLIDVPTYPGNSGGPVVSKPEVAAIQGTPVSNRAMLVGITSASINYSDVAVSQQTGRPRVTFEENSGLSVVFPMDYVNDAIGRHMGGHRGE